MALGTEAMTGGALRKRLVLDANILLRASLGTRVRSLIETYWDSVAFCAPEECFRDARKYIAEIAKARDFHPGPSRLVLEQMTRLVADIENSALAPNEVQARSRISSRDSKDWPIVAAALLLECPIWTEDQDFFGCGVATWTTRTVEIYLRNA